ncbi:MAG: OmpA family protein [Polyangiales bacterium]
MVRGALILAFAFGGCEPPRSSAAPVPPTAPPIVAVADDEEKPLPPAPAKAPPYTDLRVHARGPILFEFGSAKLHLESLQTIDDLAKQLADHPDIGVLVIEVHSDERGNPTIMLNLTNLRAASLRAALIDRGTDPSRLVAIGYGGACPLDPSHNEAAWAKNRRIELFVYENANGCTNAPIGCGATALPNLPACKQP